VSDCVTASNCACKQRYVTGHMSLLIYCKRIRTKLICSTAVKTHLQYSRHHQFSIQLCAFISRDRMVCPLKYVPLCGHGACYVSRNQSLVPRQVAYNYGTILRVQFPGCLLFRGNFVLKSAFGSLDLVRCPESRSVRFSEVV